MHAVRSGETLRGSAHSTHTPKVEYCVPVHGSHAVWLALGPEPAPHGAQDTPSTDTVLPWHLEHARE